MLKQLLAILLLPPLLCSVRPAPALAQDAVHPGKDALIKRLSVMTPQDGAHSQFFQQLATQDPELTYAVFHEGWTRIENPSTRWEFVNAFFRGNMSLNGIETPAYTPNPHLLDIIATTLGDAPWSTVNKPGAERDIARELVAQELLGLAFREIAGPEEFTQWRASVAGQSIAAIVQEGSRRVVADLETGGIDQKLKTLSLLRKLTYYTGTSVSTVNNVTTRGHEAQGLMKIRRDALVEAKLPAALAKLIRPENPERVRQDSVRILARFQPSDDVLKACESDLKRELPRLLEGPVEAADPNPFHQPDNLTELLGGFTGDWAVDVTVKLLENGAAAGAPDWRLTNALQYSHNPRAIPALIGLLDLTYDAHTGYNPYDNILRQIAGLGWNGGADREHDPVWWRLWWHDNKKRYPADVQNLSIPRFRKVNAQRADPTAALASRRRVERMLISEDPRRAYWLISPGWTAPIPLTDTDRAAIANSGLKKLAAVKPDRPGLIVLLLDEDAAEPAALDSWLDMSDALARRYFLAVAIRPHWSERTLDRWLTQRDRTVAPEAQITTETFAEQIVRQMESNAALDTDRVFLAAEGKSGMAAFACALQKDTPFTGFCLLSAPFRSSLLPPLSAAKNRRFFLALGMQGKGGGDTLAAAAEPILKQQGAVVQVDQIKDGSAIEGIRRGAAWLAR